MPTVMIGVDGCLVVGSALTDGQALIEVVDDGEHRLPAHEDRVGVGCDPSFLLSARVHEVAVLAHDVAVDRSEQIC